MNPDEIVKALRYCATGPKVRECVLCDYDTQKPHCRDSMAADAAGLIESQQAQLAAKDAEIAELLQKAQQLEAQAPNEPLTLDELRGMYMEPVWCDWMNLWALVNIDAQSKLEFTYCDSSQNTYDSLVYCGINPLAYRRPPERIEAYDDETDI